MAQQQTVFTAKSPLDAKGINKYLCFTAHHTLEKAVWSFVALGIPDILAKNSTAMSAKEISQFDGNNWNAEFLYRLLRVIADAEIIRVVNNQHELGNNQPEETVHFELTDDGRLLVTGDPSRAREVVLVDLSPSGDRISEKLPGIIKNGYKDGNSFEQVYGASLFDYMQKDENKEFAELFNHSMVGYTYSMLLSMSLTVDFSRFNRIVDIAGGLGTLICTIMEKNPSVHGILFDLPHAIDQVKADPNNEFQRRKFDSSRYELITGDMFKAETIPVADAYTLKYIIHDWDDEKSIEILKAIRSANSSFVGKKISIFFVEMVILSNEREHWEIHAMDLDMLAYVSAKERTLNEYIKLLEMSGFTFKQVSRLDNRHSIVEGETVIE